MSRGWFKNRKISKMGGMLNLFFVIATTSIFLFNHTTMAWGEAIKVEVVFPEQVKAGEAFEAKVTVNQVQKLDAASYDLLFDHSVMQITDIVNGQINNKTIPVDVWREIEPGRVIVVQNLPGISGVSGSGYLAKLSCTLLKLPTRVATLSFSNGVLSNDMAQEIPAQWLESRLLTNWLTGDINGDGIVNLDDIELFVPVYGLRQGQAGFEPSSDLNNDGRVDLFDLVLLARNFTKD